MSVTVEEVMNKAAKYAGLTAAAIHSDTPENNRMEESAFDELRAALTALVAQARDEEAWACASVVHSAMTCVMTCDASGHPATEYINRAQTVTDIRARIAARKGAP